MKPILPQYVFGQRIGNRLRFAVEFEAYKLRDGSFPRMWNEWWGYLWLWMDGRLVGNPLEYEFIWSGLGPLVKDASETGKRGSSLLSTYQPKEDQSFQALKLHFWFSVYIALLFSGSPHEPAS